MKVHIYDFRWTDETTVEFQASRENKFGKKQVHTNDDFSVEICSEVYCAGNRIDDIWVSCSEKAQGRSKCEICKQKEQRETFVFTTFDGFNQEFLKPEDLEKITGSHIVYLAFFDKNLIKVGVSKKERKRIRQLEQGSLATLFIAETPNGIEARKIETILKKNGIVDKIQGDQKKGIIIPEISTMEIQKILEEVLKKQKNEFPREYEILKKYFSETPEFISWEQKYNIQYLQENKKPLHMIELKKGEWVSGKIRSIRGSFLVIETPEELVGFNAKDLQGYDGEFDAKTPGLKTNIALQNTLF